MKKKQKQKQRTLLSFFAKPPPAPSPGGGGEAEEPPGGGPGNAERTNGGGPRADETVGAPAPPPGPGGDAGDGDGPPIDRPPADDDAGGPRAPDAGPKTGDGAPPAKVKSESNGDATDSTRPTSGESEEERDSSDGESDSDDEESDDPAGEGQAPVPPAGADGKSAYELLRERNIARNNARLRELGLVTEEVREPPRKRPAAKRRRPAGGGRGGGGGPPVPARRSRRLRRAAAGGAPTEKENGESAVPPQREEAEAEPEPEEFTVSPLFEYQMAAYVARMEGEGETTRRQAEPETPQQKGGGITTLVPTGTRLNPPSGLSAVYTLQFRPDDQGGRPSPWIVGGGKAGIVSLWDSSRPANDHGVVDPVVSFKGHSGRWIADARFVPAGRGPASSSGAVGLGGLLTAGNDGTVCHWDLASTSVKTGAPRLIGQSGKGLHSGGIFSMDVCIGGGDVSIATGSKDKTLAVTSLDGLDGAPAWRSDFHSAKVGCVSFPTCAGGGRLVASASDDGLVAVHDVRSRGTKGGPAVVLKDAHGRPHSAVWKPGSDTVLATAGLDDAIKLWDIRKASGPAATYRGHVPGSGRRLRRIHRPAFASVGGETFLLSGGEGSGSVSMFRVDGGPSGENGEEGVFSRGRLPDDAGDVGSVAVRGGGRVAIAVEGGEVLMLSPA